MQSQTHCRLCLKIDHWGNPVSIFGNNLTLPSKVKDLLGVDLENDDLLPKVMCHLCLAKLAFLDEFYSQVKTSANLLNSIIASKSTNVVTERTENVRNEDCSSEPPPRNLRKVSVNVGPVVNTSVERNVLSGRNKAKKRVYKCSRCSFKTTDKNVFDSHNKELFRCNTCDKEFCSVRALSTHQRIMAHRRKKQQVKHSDKDDLSDEKSADNEENTIIYRWCKECDKVFLGADKFKKHNEEAHKSDCDKGAATSNIFEEKNTVVRIIKEEPVDTNSSEKQCENVDIGQVKRKRSNSSTELFICWKCKCEFDSQSKFFVHSCSSVAKERVGDLSPTNIGRDNRKRRLKFTCSSSSSNVSDNSDVSNDVDHTIQIEPIEQNELTQNTYFIVSDGENSGSEESNAKMNNTHTIKSNANEVDTNINTKELRTAVDSESGNSSSLKNSSIKKCNECNKIFTSMKELFDHKQIHKTT